MRNDCPYCSDYRVSKTGKALGKFFYTHTEYYDPRRKYRARKKVKAYVDMPNGRHPHLKVDLLFHDSSEKVMNINIKYCPFCGRALGKYGLLN